MSRIALVLNAGSSSLKFSVYHPQVEGEWQLDSHGHIETRDTSPLLRVVGADGQVRHDEPLKNSATAESLLDWIDSQYSVPMVGIGHRVVHGGSRFTGPARITPEVMAELKALTPLAPLHQPQNLAPIEVLLNRYPNVPQIACFDTCFHRGHSEVAKLVPLPHELLKGGVERYGFHGLSYESIATSLPNIAPEIADGRIMIAHLGNGASLCALDHRRSLDTTMSFSAIDGLCMGTRPGAIDPGIVLYLFQQLGLSVQQVEEVLYNRSGLLGISGISHDMRDLLSRDTPAAKLAVDYFVYRAAKEIGAMAAVLGGLDGLVFTAGIGEHSSEIRRRILEASAWLGVEIDPQANAVHGPRISTRSSRVSAWVIPTNEEGMIARHMRTMLAVD